MDDPWIEIVMELQQLRAAMKKQKAREAELADTLKAALAVGIEVPGVKLAEAAPKLTWAPNALGTARELAPDLVREELVPRLRSSPNYSTDARNSAL